MAGSLNRVLLIGNLTQDPECRRMNDGSPVINLRLATNETWKDRNSGERRERAEFHRVVIFNEHLAKVAEEYLRKGSKVYIEGQIATRKWTDNNGQERYTTEIVLQRYRGELQMLDGKQDGASNTSGGYADHSRGEGFDRASPDVGDGENFPF